jgi:hypothetical protein
MEKFYMNDSIFALIGVVLGWGLSQLTELIKSHCRTSNLKKSISLELEDIEKIFYKKSISAKKVASDFLSGSPPHHIEAPVITPVLDRYYIDVLPHYSKNQRQNIRDIKNFITLFNKRSESLMTEPSKNKFEHGFRLIELYKHSLMAQILLQEANKNSGKKEISDDHPAFAEVSPEIINLLKKLDHFKT